MEVREIMNAKELYIDAEDIIKGYNESKRKKGNSKKFN